MRLSSRLQSLRQKISDSRARYWQQLQQRRPKTAIRLSAYWRLMRMDRRIGIYLLLWPTLWCLWIAGEGRPDFKLLVIFSLGTLLMRAAGCCFNDYADRKFDAHVARTRERPLANGEIQAKEALLLGGGLCLLAFLLVLMTNGLTILMAFAGLAITLIYPYMKRHTHLPQLVLGAAFSWGGMMAFTAQTGTLPAQAWLLYIAALTWIIAYDTQYAMVDREDDLKIGVKSTAILFAEADLFVIGFLQVFFLLTLALSANIFGLGNWFQFGLLIAALLFVYQHSLTWSREPAGCFKAFLNNNYVGMAVFAFTVIDYLL